jgi:hypothetical protein
MRAPYGQDMSARNLEDMRAKLLNNNGGDGKPMGTVENFSYAEYYRNYEEPAMLQIRKDELAWITKHSPDVVQKVDVVLNLSCGAMFQPHQLLQLVDICKALGLSIAAVAGRQYCCGRIYHRFGRIEDGDKMTIASTRRFEEFAPTQVAQVCGSCAIMFDYEVERRKEAGSPTGFETVHLNRFLGDVLREMGDRVPWKKSVKRRVLMHGHVWNDDESEYQAEALRTLALIPGVEIVGEVRTPALGAPCVRRKVGGPPNMWEISPEQYTQVVAEFQAEADAVGADAWCHVYPNCTAYWSRFSTDRLASLHYMQILGEALGCPQPDRYLALFRLGDPELMLQRSRVNWESWGLAEDEARALVRKHFLPEFAEAIPRCPCNGRCAESSRVTACDTTALSWLKRGDQQLPVLSAQA